MFSSLISAIFGCAHKRTTFPLTPSRHARVDNRMARKGGTYIVCLDCGRELDYDLQKMKVCKSQPADKSLFTTDTDWATEMPIGEEPSIR